MRNWKQKVGRWHVGQVVVAVGVLAAIAWFGPQLADVVDYAGEWVDIGGDRMVWTTQIQSDAIRYASYLPYLVGVVILWTWFGARKKP